MRAQISGYDSCAHLSEETKSADRNAAWGILAAVSISVVLGLGYILALLFSIQVSITPQKYPRKEGKSLPLNSAGVHSSSKDAPPVFTAQITVHNRYQPLHS